MLGRKGMVELLIAAFPTLEEELVDPTWRGLTHLELACFTRYTQAQIDAGARQAVEACFALAGRLLAEGNPEVRNAIAVSYLEDLNFTDGKRVRAWAAELMPAKLHREYLAVTGQGAEGRPA